MEAHQMGKRKNIMENTIATTTTNSDMLQRLIDAEVALRVKNEMDSLKPMDTEADKGELYEALSRAQSNFDQVKKSGKANIPTKSGGNYSYSFAKLSDVLAATVPALNAEGIYFSQNPKHSFTNNGGALLTIVSTLSHRSGATLSYESIPLFYNMNDAKQAGSVMTYLRRYSACQILGIEGDEDDDANVAMESNSSFGRNSNQNGPTSAKKPAKKQPPKKQEQDRQLENSVTPVCRFSDEDKGAELVATESVELKQPVETEEVKSDEQLDSQVDEGVEEVTEIPKAPARDMDAIFRCGLNAAEEYGATPAQLDEWINMDREAAIESMSDFVRSAMA